MTAPAPPVPRLEPSARLALALLGGLCASQGSVHAPVLAWLAAPLFFVALFRAPARRAPLLGAAFGLAEAVNCFSAASYGALVVTLLLVLHAASRVLLAGLAAVILRFGPGRPLPLIGAALAMPLVDALWEASWGRFSLPLSLANTQASVTSVLQVVACVGVYGLTAAMSLFGVLVASALIGREEGRVRRLVLAFAVPLFCAAFGALRLAAASPEARHIDLVAVQGGVPNWAYEVSPWLPAVEREIERRYLGATQRIEPPLDLVLWPETAVRPAPARETELHEALASLSEALGAVIVAGVPQTDTGGAWRNLAVIFEGGQERGRSAKQRTVPFVEDRLLPGAPAEVVATSAGRLGVLICAESLDPWRTRELVAAGAELVVIIANDAGFGAAPSGRLHAERAALRAVEHGVSVVHADQFAGSRAYDSYGRLIAHIPPGRGVLRARLPLRPPSG